MEIVLVSISRLRYYIIVLQDVTVGGNLSKEYKGISLYYFLQLHVNLQWSQNKTFALQNKKPENWFQIHTFPLLLDSFPVPGQKNVGETLALGPATSLL